MQVDRELIVPAAVAFFAAFVTVLALGPRVIAWLRVVKFGQNINEYAPQSHQQKQGTPTMGGVLLVIGVALALVIESVRAHSLSAPVLAVALVFAAHALLGFGDDFRKARRGKSLGLKAREKLAGQFVIAILFAGWLYLTRQPEFTSVITVGPGARVDLGWAYYPVVVLLMVWLSNAANFTDGLDGLAGGLTILISLGLAWTVYHFGANAQLPTFGYALAGACLGFLWYNAHPAKVFMGDTGSLAIGGSLAAMAIVGKQEVLLLTFALVFLAEIISVMIQVPVFKITGKRVFRMTPLHHHFELLGWAETHVVARFWIAGALLLALGLALAPWLSPFVGR